MGGKLPCLKLRLFPFRIREKQKGVFMGYCRVCRDRWGGVSGAHCTGCHRTFKGVSGFDRHRVGGKCLVPMDLGMECSEKGFWFSPMSETARSKLRVL